MKMVEPFRAIVIDPPWAFKDRLPGRRRGAAKHYLCAGIGQIQDAVNLMAWGENPGDPGDALQDYAAARDSLLFCWRVSAMQPEALELIRRLGFEVKSEIVWEKLTASGKKAHFGMGRYVRAAHETCLIATRGRGSSLIKNHSVRSVFKAAVGRHSEKPEAFFDIVESLADGPYLELFARRKRPGWTCRGNEVQP